ncbi:Putative integral membrane signalling protein, MHYT sensor domain (fragment) (plasmid) [Cupriavidus taiwanensis]|uniref:Integral membrane signalling protein, MHYT sensor domain n=1 Tax=Cupriavidus taiwanensis TaxID=164546 RepID=A0A375HIF7_9BURK
MICSSPTYAPSLFAIEGDSIGHAVFGLSLITQPVLLVVEDTTTSAVAATAALASTRDPA